MAEGTESEHPGVVEEHIVPPAVRKRLQQCFEHGTKLTQQEPCDFDYAHSMFLDCVLNDPGNVVYLEALFENLRRKYNNNKKGSRFSFGGKSGFKKALGQQDWPEVFKQGLPLLKANPWNVAALRGLAEACAAYGYFETELRYLRYALEVNPKDPDVNRHCAQSLSRIGQFEQAIVCWQRVDEATGGNSQAQEEIASLQYANTRSGSVEDRGKHVRVPKNSITRPIDEASKPGESEPRREIPLTKRQQLEQAIALNPNDLNVYFKLARLHQREDRMAEAVMVLNKAAAASGNDLKVQEKLEDLEIEWKTQQVQIAEQRASNPATDEEKQLIARLRMELNRFELSVYEARSQRYPASLELVLELGLRLKRVGNYVEAKRCFEDSARRPELKARSNLELGECLQREKQYSPAFDSYRLAVEQSTRGPDQEVLKLALYRCGVLAAGLGMAGPAEDYFKQLLELDSDYRDAPTRLDKIKEMRHKE